MAHGHDHGRDGSQIGRRTAAQPGEGGRAAQVAEHVAGLGFVQRRDGQPDVADGLDQHAAEPGHDHRAEFRVPDPADDQLQALTLRLDEHCRAFGQGQQAGRGAFDCIGGEQAEPDPAHVALVGQGGVGDLGHHGIAEPVSGLDRGGGAVAPGGLDDRDAGADQQIPGGLR